MEKPKNIPIEDIENNINVLEESIAVPEKTVQYGDKRVENRSPIDNILALNLMNTLKDQDNGFYGPPTFTIVKHK